MNTIVRWGVYLVIGAVTAMPATSFAQSSTYTPPGTGTDPAQNMERPATRTAPPPGAPVQDRPATDRDRSAVSDSWITAKTKIALFGDDRVSGWEVNVDTKSGVVSLTGKVDSAEAKARAEQVARDIDGVREVRNNLQVVSEARRERVDAKDGDLKDRIERQISQDSRFKGADIDVKVNDGVVQLTGEVDTVGQSAAASERARRVPGVRAVKNELKVKRDDRFGMDGRDDRLADRDRPAVNGDRLSRTGLPAREGMVRQAQEALKAKGFDPGAIDGVMGEQTREAIREFQKAEKLPVTGQLDPATLKGLGLDSQPRAMQSR
jgi:hyperosmotically inducible protein